MGAPVQRRAWLRRLSGCVGTLRRPAGSHPFAPVAGKTFDLLPAHVDFEKKEETINTITCVVAAAGSISETGFYGL